MDGLGIGGKFDRGRNRVVIADGGMAQENFVDNFLAVDRIFYGKAHIDIIEGGNPDVHWQGVVTIAGYFDDLDIRVLTELTQGLEISAADKIDLVGGDGAHAGGDIGNCEEFDLVEIGQARLEVVRIFLELGGDARLEVFIDERPGPYA